jgi:lipoprotein NlpD
VAVVGRGTRGAAILAALVLGAGCGAAHLGSERAGGGIYHDVIRGENLYRIGKAYGVSHQELARANRLANPNRVEIGQRLFIPGGKRRLPVNLITPRNAVASLPPPEDLPRGAPLFVWPVDGTLTSTFGPRGASYHDGIDIAAPEGTPVRAARDGVVIYSDSLRGYGRVVIVEHHGGYATVYAHNEKNLVDAGTRVRQGDAIARVGDSGRTSGPNLHFEVRKDNVARNPIYFLPRMLARRGEDERT